MSRARQSMYPGPIAPTYWSTLDACSQSLSHASSSLNNATVTLHQGTYDFIRLAKVVNSRRAFDIVTESEVQAAQRALESEVQPQIAQLIERAEVGLEAIKKREKLVRAKVEKRAHMPARPQAEAPDLNLRERELQQLRAKKEALGKELERLDDQIELSR